MNQPAARSITYLLGSMLVALLALTSAGCSTDPDVSTSESSVGEPAETTVAPDASTSVSSVDEPVETVAPDASTTSSSLEVPVEEGCEAYDEVVSVSDSYTLKEEEEDSETEPMWLASPESSDTSQFWVLQTPEGIAGPSVWVWQFNAPPLRISEFDEDEQREIGERAATPTSNHPLMRTMMFTDPSVDIEAAQDLVLAISVNTSDEEAWELAPEILRLVDGEAAELGELAVARSGHAAIPPVNADGFLEFTHESRTLLRVWHGCFDPDPTTDIRPTDLVWFREMLLSTFASLTGAEEAVPISIGPASGLLFRIEANDDDEFYLAIVSTPYTSVVVYHEAYNDPIGVVAEVMSSTLEFQ